MFYLINLNIGLQRLREAIDGLQEGFALFDAKDRLIDANEIFLKAYVNAREVLASRGPFESLIRGNVESGLIVEAKGREEEFIQQRLEQRHNSSDAILRQLSDGTWRLVQETATPEGGIAQTIVDVTEIKQAEENLQKARDELLKLANERASVAEQCLRDTIKNLTHGFVLYDSDECLVICNANYTKDLGLTPADVKVGEKYDSVSQKFLKASLANPEEFDQALQDRIRHFRNPGDAVVLPLADGRWLSIADHKTVDGGTIEISFDVSAFKNAENDLHEAKEEAEAANAAKSEFLSAMSHELRTPMNAILGFGQMLEFHPSEPLSDEQKFCVDRIMAGGHHLLSLIDQVLDLEIIDSGKMELSIEEIFTDNACLESLSLIEGQAQARELKVTADLRATHSIKADGTRFKQVLINLLSNAIKYNRAGGSITVTSKDVPEDRVRVSVKDTGEGIAKEKQAELFQPFNRLGKEAGEIEGTGIGLTITKELVEAMGGTVGLESTVGSGSTFWIEFPAHNLLTANSAREG
jgi:signal transduction histidine kinase